MNVKKQYSQEAAPLSEQLAAYAQQAQTYQRQTALNPFSLDWKKGTLAALVPFIAANSLEAQCQGPVNGGANITVANDGNFLVDMDGDGTKDMKIFAISGILRIQPLGANHVLGASSQVLAAGNILRNNGYFTTIANTLCGASATNFCSGTNYIACRKGDATTGKVGWIAFEMVNQSSTQFTFKITQRGYASTSVASVTAGVCSTLPIELSRFTVKPIEKAMTLNWETQSETNNSGFEIQRSTDGKTFSKMAWIEGHGTTNTVQQYAFTDEKVEANVVYYYRLRQLDTDGTAHLSPVQAGQIVDGNVVQVGEVHPNPAVKGHGFWIPVQVPEAGAAQLQVYDVQGRLVQTLNQSVEAGRTRLQVSLQDVPAGNYFVKVAVNGRNFYKKLVIQ